MKQIFIFLIMCAYSFSCIATTTELLANTTYNLQPNSCIHIIDVNITINWTPKNYNVNTTILDGGTYYNSEANIQVSTPTDKCIDRGWTTIYLNASQIYPDSETKTFYQCAASHSCPSFPIITEYLDPGQTRIISGRNVTCIANSCPSPAFDYCFKNYNYDTAINTTQRYQYDNLETNVSIDIQFNAPVCNICNTTNITCPIINTTTKTIIPTCGAVTNDDERHISIVNTACPTPLAGALHLIGGQSHTYGAPHSLAIDCAAETTEADCPVCPSCQICPVCVNTTYHNISGAEMNYSALMQYDGENCSSTTQVCRDYFYALQCTQQEADSGNLPSCVSRVYLEKDTTISNCNSEKQICEYAKQDLQEQYSKVKQDQEWVLWLIGGIILLVAFAIGIPLTYAALKKANIVEEKRIMPNPELEEKKG